MSWKPEPGEAERALRHAKTVSEMARQEIDMDFPLLHAHALVGIWGALEVCIDDASVAVLQHDAKARKDEHFAKVKLSLSEFESLAIDDRMRLLLDEAKRSFRSEHRVGVNVFECVLDPLGLSGKVDDVHARNLLEAQQLRHVIVHRGGVADRRLLDRCPWLPFSQNQPIKLGRDDLVRLFGSISAYVASVEARLAEKYDRQRS